MTERQLVRQSSPMCGIELEHCLPFAKRRLAVHESLENLIPMMNEEATLAQQHLVVLGGTRNDL